MKKRIPKKGYRVLAIAWTLAAASMAVAVVRRLAEFNLLLILLLVLSTLTAASFWKAYHRTPEEAAPGPFDAPPRFADNPVLFDDDPVLIDDGPEPAAHPNKDSEENDNER